VYKIKLTLKNNIQGVPCYLLLRFDLGHTKITSDGLLGARLPIRVFTDNKAPTFDRVIQDRVEFMFEIKDGKNIVYDPLRLPSKIAAEGIPLDAYLCLILETTSFGQFYATVVPKITTESAGLEVDCMIPEMLRIPTTIAFVNSSNTRLLP